MILIARSALSEPTRLAAMRIPLDGGEHCVCEPMRRLDATQSRMSQSMQVMKRAALMVDRWDAQWVRYRIRPDLPQHLQVLLSAALVEEVIA